MPETLSLEEAREFGIKVPNKRKLVKQQGQAKAKIAAPVEVHLNVETLIDEVDLGFDDGKIADMINQLIAVINKLGDDQKVAMQESVSKVIVGIDALGNSLKSLQSAVNSAAASLDMAKRLPASVNDAGGATKLPAVVNDPARPRTLEVTTKDLSGNPRSYTIKVKQ